MQRLCFSVKRLTNGRPSLPASAKRAAKRVALVWFPMVSRCPLDGTGSSKFGAECSERMMREVRK